MFREMIHKTIDETAKEMHALVDSPYFPFWQCGLILAGLALVLAVGASVIRKQNNADAPWPKWLAWTVAGLWVVGCLTLFVTSLLFLVE